jgi:hypothetical protein
MKSLRLSFNQNLVFGHASPQMQSRDSTRTGNKRLSYRDLCHPSEDADKQTFGRILPLTLTKGATRR